MKIVTVPVEYQSPLVNKYLADFAEVGHLYEHNPYEFNSFQDRYEVIRRDYRTDRNELVRILTEYNEKLHCGTATRDNLGKLEDPSTTVVITGQQAGVCTGPLYTIYKTITVIQLAGEIARSTGRNVIPMFWVASEDHDFAEIDHLWFVNHRQELVRTSLDEKPVGKQSVGHIPVTDAVVRLIEQLEAETSPSEWKEGIVNKLKELAAESDNLADWFAAVMCWLFQKHGLVMVNPLVKGLRRLLSGTFEDFLKSTDLVNERLQSGMAKVRTLGIEPQVETFENHVHLFLYVDGERLPLLKSGDVYTVRGRELVWSIGDLTDLARNRPELLSPNVVLRPVAQDVLLPITAYVAGPGEISYYALYREIYPIFNQRMPVIYPRVNTTLIERSIAKHMDKYGVKFSDGYAGIKRKLDDYLETQDGLGIDRLFGGYADELKKSFGELMGKVAVIDPELTKHGYESLNRILHQVDYLEKKAHQCHRKSCDVAVKRFHALENQLFPRNNWQERVLNIFPYLFKYGYGLTDQLVKLPLTGDNRHRLIYLGD